MTTVKLALNRSLVGLEWFARIASVVSIGLLVTLFIGEGLHPSQVAAREWVALLFFPVGVMAGMVIAWWREGIGAVVTVWKPRCFLSHLRLFLKKSHRWLGFRDVRRPWFFVSLALALTAYQ